MVEQPPPVQLSDEDHAAKVRSRLVQLHVAIKEAKQAGLDVKVDADSYLLGMTIHLDRAVRVIRVY
jgi:hypothetical protein